MGDKGIGIAAEDYPSCKAAVDAGQQYPTTLRVEAGSEGIHRGGDVADVDRGKRESCGAACVRDRDPARGQLLPHRLVGFAWVRELDDIEVTMGRHGLPVPGCFICSIPS
jgi:hypothetical protein